MTGCVPPVAQPHLDSGLIGFMVTPNIGNKRKPAWVWSADSGCFNRATYKGDDNYISWLTEQHSKDRCLFATAPDVLGDGQATVALALTWLPLIRSLGYRPALVTQDGMTPGIPQRQRARGVPAAGGDVAAADAGNGERQEHAGHDGLDGERSPQRRGAVVTAGTGGSGVDPDGRVAGSHAASGSVAAIDDGVGWGKYAPAIHRWERVLGRPAPAPTVPGVNGRPRLSAYFTEWLMGLPPGHVTGHGLSSAQALKALGNGVVPQQAALALRMLGGLPATGPTGGGALLPTPKAGDGERGRDLPRMREDTKARELSTAVVFMGDTP